MTKRATLERQLRDYFSHLDDHDTQRSPVDDPAEFTFREMVGSENGSGPHDPEQQQTDKEIAMLQKNQSSTPRNRWYPMAGAMLLVVGAGAALLWAVGSDDEPDPATSGNDSEVGQSPDGPYTPADSEFFVSQQIIEAISQGDAETAASLTAPGAPLIPWGELEIPLDSAIEWMGASDITFDLEECLLGSDSIAATVNSLCTVTITNAWTEALGLDPLENRIRLQFDEDGQVALILWDELQWWNEVHSPFIEFVRDSRPDDWAAMCDNGRFAEHTFGNESMALFETHTELFVEAMAQS